MQISIESGALYRRCSTLPWLLGVAFWQICYWYDVWHVTQGCRLKGPNFLDDLLADLNRKNACMYKEMNIPVQSKPYTLHCRPWKRQNWVFLMNFVEHVNHWLFLQERSGSLNGCAHVTCLKTSLMAQCAHHVSLPPSPSAI